MNANWFIAGGCTSAAAYELLIIGSPVWAAVFVLAALANIVATLGPDRDARF